MFDRGYWNLIIFRDLTTNGIRFITRLKKGVKYTIINKKKGRKWEDMEILNKDLKSNLKIDHLIGKNLNAVLIQIFATLIAYLLIALFRIFHNSLLSLREIKRLMKYYGSQSVREVARAYPMLCTYG